MSSKVPLGAPYMLSRCPPDGSNAITQQETQRLENTNRVLCSDIQVQQSGTVALRLWTISTRIVTIWARSIEANRIAGLWPFAAQRVSGGLRCKTTIERVLSLLSNDGRIQQESHPIFV